MTFPSDWWIWHKKSLKNSFAARSLYIYIIWVTLYSVIYSLIYVLAMSICVWDTLSIPNSETSNIQDLSCSSALYYIALFFSFYLSILLYNITLFYLSIYLSLYYITLFYLSNYLSLYYITLFYLSNYLSL